jgi:hypothetical protein
LKKGRNKIKPSGYKNRQLLLKNRTGILSCHSNERNNAGSIERHIMIENSLALLVVRTPF